jgi:hypothetical protein
MARQDLRELRRLESDPARRNDRSRLPALPRLLRHRRGAGSGARRLCAAAVLEVPGGEVKYPEAKCPVCGWIVSVRKGRLTRHGRNRTPDGCDGSGLTLDEVSDFVDDRTENNPEPKVTR